MAWKRWITMWLATVMLMGVYPTSAFTADGGTDVTVQLGEAEVANYQGFSVQADVVASGLQGLRSVSSGASISINTEITNNQSSVWIWVRAQGKRYADRISVKADGMLVQSVPVYSTLGYRWHRIGLGEAIPKEITLTANASDILVDNYIITTEAELVASGISGIQNENEAVAYYPANPMAEKQNYPFMRENNGSFYAEAEDGKIEGMEIMEIETASGGKYVHVPSATQTDPYARSTPNLGFRFHVEQDGTYAVWVRYYTPEKGAKSSWISIDGKNFSRLDTSMTSQWKWAKTNIVNLAAGDHVLDIRYRQPKHRLDCFVVTPNLSFTPIGLGNLPGEEVRPNLRTYEERVIPRVYLNGEEVITNTIGEKVGNALVVPIRSFCEKLGYTYYVTEEYGAIYKERNYLRMTEGSSTVIVNGETVTAGAPVTREKNEFNIDFAVVAEFLGIAYTVDENNQIYCTYDSKEDITWENTLESRNGLRIVLTNSREADYYYECNSEDYDVVSVYYRQDGDIMWKKGYDPVYVNGAFRGGFSLLNELGKYTMKMILAKGSEVTVLYQSWQSIHQEYTYPFVSDDYQGDDPVVIKRSISNSAPEVEEQTKKSTDYFIPHSDTITLVPTYENISCYLDYQNEGTECTVYYREKGTEDWKEAYELYDDETNKQFRGSITGLDEGKIYEVKAVLSGADSGEYISETTMWTTEVPIAKEYTLSELYDPDACEGGLQLQYLKGTPDGWIKIKGVEGDNTITASKNVDEAVWIANCEYVILEDLVISGGYYNGICVANNSKDIRISNCDISGWGVPGIVNIAGMYCDYTGNSEKPNLNSGVKIADTKNVTVEKCFIHDPSGRTNCWSWGHPAGPSGISIRSAGGSVIRYNDFVGSELYRWNDAIESYYNFHISGGPARDCDIYGNVMMNGQDDGTELDGGQMNARFYNNLVQTFLCGISTIPMIAGPSYIFKNVFTNLGTEENGVGAVYKTGPGVNIENIGLIHIFNNTMITSGNGISQYKSYPNVPYNVISRNNIIAVTGQQIYNPELNCDYDYDLLINLTGGSVATIMGEDQEKHGIQPSTVGVTDYMSGLYAAREGGPAQDVGTDLKNFTEGYNGSKPDLGAFESGSNNTAFPIRPVVVQADRYLMMLSADKTEGSFELYLKEGIENQKVKLQLTEFDKTWLSVADENGNTEFEIKAGEPVTVYVKADISVLESYIIGANWNQGKSNEKGMAGVVIEQEDGHSILVTINYRKKWNLWARS